MPKTVSPLMVLFDGRFYETKIDFINLGRIKIRPNELSQLIYYIKLYYQGASSAILHIHFKKNSESELTELVIKLKSARNRLQQVWDNYGSTNDRVLKASRDFDRIENEYQKLIRQIDEKGVT